MFFLLYWIPFWAGFSSPVLYVLIWVVFLFIEVTDVIDGYLARKLDMVTDLGKLLDPFSDVISRITYFISFAVVGIMHPVFCLIILYREFGIVFIRMILAQKGIALAAGAGGKLKSVFYFLGAAAGLGMTGLGWFSDNAATQELFQLVTHGIFGIATVLALVSFVQYLVIFRKAMHQQ